MERVTANEAMQLVESSARLTHGTGSHLTELQLGMLSQLCRQMQAYYPHQEFAEETIQGYQFDFERLTAIYGFDRMRTVLLRLRIRPGQKFFPHPSEVSEALKDLMIEEGKEARKLNPWVSCGRCGVSGMVVAERNGARFAARCGCWLQWSERHRQIAGNSERGENGQ
jgi:hypothetical protein